MPAQHELSCPHRVQLPEGQRMNWDDKMQPCMICDPCSKKNKHKSAKTDGKGNQLCKLCPKTITFLLSLIHI